MNTNNTNEYFYVEKNKFISNYLIDKFKLWIWDFDDTLVDTTTYYKKSMEPKDILKRTNEELDVDFPNWRYFVSCVNYLVSRGVRVGIASFGTYKIIKAYMDRLFGINQRIFTDVNLKALCRSSNGKPLRFYPNKNDFIETIMKHYRIYEPLKVILFDDNMTNISDAMDSGIVGVKIIGKDNNQIINRKNSYSTNTEETYFGKYIVDKLETTLKTLEENSKNKKKCEYGNLPNETFSAIGSRKIGTINKSKRLERERFYKSIKDEYDKEQENNNNTIDTKEQFYNTNNNQKTNYNKIKKINSKTKLNTKKENFNYNTHTSNNNKINNNNINNNNKLNTQTIIIILLILICLVTLILMRK